MQILHPVLQKLKDRRDIGNLEEFSLTELTMTEKNNLERTVHFVSQK